jgi:hypothetical protein
VEKLMESIEHKARKELRADETLVCCCMLLNRAVWSVFLLAFGVVFAGVFITILLDDTPLAGLIISAVILGGFGTAAIAYGLFYLVKSRYKYCFVTDKRICFLSASKTWDIDSEDIVKAKFFPAHTQPKLGVANKHNFIVIWIRNKNGSIRKYDFVPVSNALEMMRAINSIIKL